MCFIQHADKAKYGELLKELRKGVYKGRYEYPKTVAGAYKLLMHTAKQHGYRLYRSRLRNNQVRNQNENFILAQKGNKMDDKSDVMPGKDSTTYDNVKCYA